MPRPLVTAAFCLFALSAPEARAQLQCQPALVDFGRRAENQILTAQATLTNVTPGPIKILSVQGDIGSLAADAAILALAPGESTILSIHMQTGAIEGKFQHRVLVATAEGTGAVLTVKLAVYRYANWVVEPSRLIIPPSSQGTAATSELQITHVGAVEPGILSITTGSPYFAIRAETPVGNIAAYVVRKLPEAPAGPIYSEIRVATRDPTAPILEIPVYAYVTDEKK